MRESKRNILLLSTLAAGALALGAYVRRETARRGYPSWEECRCNFKTKNTIYLVWYSSNEQRGETIVSHEWGLPLTGAPLWLRRLLHHSAQALATLMPSNSHVERVMLSPQEARQFALMLYSSSGGEEQAEEYADENSHIIWRHEVLHVPHHPFDAYTRRLYPVHVSHERSQQSDPLPAIWDPQNNLPLPSEGALLDTPIGTRIDSIGWASTQISYCTARLDNA